MKKPLQARTDSTLLASLKNIKNVLQDTFEKWLSEQDITNNPEKFFSSFHVQHEYDVSNDMDFKLDSLTLFEYFDYWFPIMKLKADGSKQKNRWQACINALCAFTDQKRESLDQTSATLYDVAMILAAINTAINTLQLSEQEKDKDKVEFQQELAKNYAAQAHSMLEEKNNAVFSEAYNNPEFTCFKQFFVVEQNETEDDFELIDEVYDMPEATYAKMDPSNVAKRLAPMQVNKVCYNMHDGVNLQDTRNNLLTHYKSFDTQTALFYCIELVNDGYSIANARLETVLSIIKDQAKNTQPLKRAIIPIAGSSLTNHFVVLVIEQNENTYRAYIVDSKAESRILNYLDPFIKETIQAALNKVFGSVTLTNKYLNHQSLLDNVKCGYYALKTIEILTKSTSANIDAILPINPNFLWSADYFLTVTDIIKINTILAEKDSLANVYEELPDMPEVIHAELAVYNQRNEPQIYHNHFSPFSAHLMLLVISNQNGFREVPALPDPATFIYRATIQVPMHLGPLNNLPPRLMLDGDMALVVRPVPDVRNELLFEILRTMQHAANMQQQEGFFAAPNNVIIEQLPDQIEEEQNTPDTSETASLSEDSIQDIAVITQPNGQAKYKLLYILLLPFTLLMQAATYVVNAIKAAGRCLFGMQQQTENNIVTLVNAAETNSDLSVASTATNTDQLIRVKPPKAILNSYEGRTPSALDVNLPLQEEHLATEKRSNCFKYFLS